MTEELKDGKTSARDTINSDGSINHVLEVQKGFIDPSDLIKKADKMIRQKEQKNGKISP